MKTSPLSLFSFPLSYLLVKSHRQLPWCATSAASVSVSCVTMMVYPSPPVCQPLEPGEPPVQARRHSLHHGLSAQVLCGSAQVLCGSAVTMSAPAADSPPPVASPAPDVLSSTQPSSNHDAPTGDSPCSFHSAAASLPEFPPTADATAPAPAATPPPALPPGAPPVVNPSQKKIIHHGNSGTQK